MVTYDMEAHRRDVRESLLRLVRQGGPGWHDYAVGRARDLEKEDPSLHRGLQQAVKAATTEPQPPGDAHGI